MSDLIKNVLYVGSNPELVNVLLSSLISNENNQVDSLTNSDGLLTALDKKQYQVLICEDEITDVIKKQINESYPELDSHFLNQQAKYQTSIETTPSACQCDPLKVSLDDISIPIYYKNRQDEVLACNHHFATFFGITQEQAIGLSVKDILPTQLLDQIHRGKDKLLNAQQADLLECEFYDADGVFHEIVIRKEIVNTGDVQIGMILDASELNKTKRLLENERIRLRATADLSPDLIFFKDLDSRFLGCNKQFEHFVGCAEKNILGKKDDLLFELGQALMCQEQDKEVMLNKEIYCGEEYLTYNNGERHFIEMQKFPLLGKEGDVQGLIGIGRDITAHHLLQKRLKVANVVFENSKESFIVTDDSGKIISANNACCEITGFSEADLLSLNINTFSFKQEDKEVLDVIGNSLIEEKSWQGNITYKVKNGDIYFAWLEVYIVEHKSEGNSSHIYSFTDLNQSRSIEQKIQFLSKHDPITGLFNRIALFTRLEDAINRANHKETAMAVLLIDIKGFKAVNDQYGHNAGDRVLKEAALRLKSCVPENEILARFGDDEFVIIIDELLNEQDAVSVALRISELFKQPFMIENIQANLSATIGISLTPDDGDDVDSLLKNAEQAMLRAKKDKNVAYHFYTAELTRHSNLQVELEAELKDALKNKQFELYYQPQYDLNKRRIVAVESLLRWNHPEQGVLLPSSFLSLAEESGLLVELGLNVISDVAKQAVTWHQQGINFGRITVNLSLSMLSQISFIADIQTILKESGCLSRWLEFEINELIYNSDSMTVHENLQHISKLGIILTIDDFGANFPVMYLTESLKVAKFKISKNYTQGFSGHLVAGAMIKSVIMLAHSLGIDIVGDGLENAQQEEFLNSSNATLRQSEPQVKAMKATEATFYLRCNKRK